MAQQTPGPTQRKLEREARLEDFGRYRERQAKIEARLVKQGYRAPTAPSVVVKEAQQEYDALSSSYFGANTTERIPGYFLVPDRFVQSDPVFVDTALVVPPLAPKPVADLLPVISTASAPPAKGNGTAASPFTLTGTAPTSKSPASFSVLLQGRNLDALDLNGAVCAPISGSGETPGIHTVAIPTAIGAEGILVTLETTSGGGAFTVLFPIKSDKDHADVAKLMTQVPSGTLHFSYAQ